MRYVLQEFGIDYAVEKQDPGIKSPMLTISRSDNGFFFSGYLPNTTVRQRFQFPQGAPVLLGFDTELDDGHATYSLPTAWNRECRIFVEQSAGIVSCKELHSGQKEIVRRLQVTGLNKATVRIYAAAGVTEAMMHAYVNSAYPWRKGRISVKTGDKKYGHHFVVENVTGDLVVAW